MSKLWPKRFCLPDTAQTQVFGAHDLHTLVRYVDDVARFDGGVGFGVPALVRVVCERGRNVR